MAINSAVKKNWIELQKKFLHCWLELLDQEIMEL